jgi:basic membrane protein A
LSSGDSPQNKSRRRFLKYAVTGAVVAGAAAFGGYELLVSPSSPLSGSANTFKALAENAGPSGTAWGEAQSLGETIATKNITSKKVVWYNAWNLAPADITSVFDSYVQQGVKFIFDSDFTQSTVDPWVNAHPDVYVLEPAFTNSKAPNVGTYNWGINIGAFFQGIVGGAVTKKNKIGLVSAFNDPIDGQAFNDYTQGAKMVNPNVETFYSLTGDYHNVQLGYNAATALISAGCDFVVGEGDGMTEGVIKACAAANVLTAGTYFDQNSLAPNVVVTSTIWNAGVVMTDAINAILNGTFNHPNFNYDLKDNIVSLTKFYLPVPASVQQTINNAIQGNKAGTFNLDTTTTWPSSSQIG